MLMFGLRLGDNPEAVITTTPRPIPTFKAILADAATVITRGSTYENAANVAPAFLRQILKAYEGTKLGQQELHGQLVEQVDGALWTRDLIERARVRSAPALKRIVVAIDPAATSGADADETGIVVAGIDAAGEGYVLDDLSGRYSPDGWASRAVAAANAQGADRIIAEANNGGEMVEFTIRTVDKNASYRAVHASRGKRTRAEPVAALYEQQKVHHVGLFAELEDQLCTWEATSGDSSPDRLDALVWALTDLMLDGRSGFLSWMEQKATAASAPAPETHGASEDDLVLAHQACRIKGGVRTVAVDGRLKCSKCGCDLGRANT
jgi:phage terminase large subunit-like protein